MHLSTSDVTALKNRVAKTDGKLRAACRLATITDRVIYKLLAGGNIRQQTYDKFMDGLERLESYEKQKRQANSRRIKVRQLSSNVPDSAQAVIQLMGAPAKPFKIIYKDDPIKPKKKKSIFQDKQLAGDLMMKRFCANREKAIERAHKKKLQALANNKK